MARQMEAHPANWQICQAMCLPRVLPPWWVDQTFSFFSIQAIICTGALFLPRMLSRTLSALSNMPTAWRFIRIVAIFHARPCSRRTVAGDDAALYNSLLLTVKDAAQYSGRKVIVVFSNGPDNSSVVPPEDVAELAQSTGTVIYMISTTEAQLEPISTAVFERMTAATGGKAYFAKSWRDEKRAFASIRDDLAHLYSLSYYPQPNPNRGWRAINVKLVGKGMQKYRVRTRDGYRLLQQAQLSTGFTSPTGGGGAGSAQ